MRGYSTSTSDQNASVVHARTRPTRKASPRVTDGAEHPVTVRKVEPVVSRERTLSAAKAEAIARLGYTPSLG